MFNKWESTMNKMVSYGRFFVRQMSSVRQCSSSGVLANIGPDKLICDIIKINGAESLNANVH